MEKETFDVQASIKAQNEHCKTTGDPHFAPSDGKCYNCGNQIYKQIDHGNGYLSGIPLERASSLVTGCPHCHYSYCE
jgi:hypothetical protein